MQKKKIRKEMNYRGKLRKFPFISVNYRKEFLPNYFLRKNTESEIVGNIRKENVGIRKNGKKPSPTNT